MRGHRFRAESGGEAVFHQAGGPSGRCRDDPGTSSGGPGSIPGDPAVPTDNPDLISKLLDGTVEGVALDIAAVKAAVRRAGVEGGDIGTLRWEGDGGHVFVDVLPDHVIVTRSSTGGPAHLKVADAVLVELKKAGLHVWDPQQGRWV